MGEPAAEHPAPSQLPCQVIGDIKQAVANISYRNSASGRNLCYAWFSLCHSKASDAAAPTEDVILISSFKTEPVIS